MMKIPAKASGRVRSVRATLVKVDRRRRGGLRANPSSGEAVAATLAVISGDPNPRVEDSVHDIDQEVDDDIDGGYEQRDSQQTRIVEL